MINRHQNYKDNRTGSFTNAAIVSSTKKHNQDTDISSLFSGSSYSLSTVTYSTSAIANASNMTLTSTSSTDDTLSMISTPWSTETWTCPSYTVPSQTSKSISLQFWSQKENETASHSTITVLPQSSTSSNVPKTQSSESKMTFTLPDLATIPTTTESIHPVSKKNSRVNTLDTLSSWTLESFTSHGLMSDFCTLRPNYSWSPSTVFSSTDIYPSTLETLVSRKGSRETLMTSGTFGSKNIKKDVMIPMNHAVMKTKLEENSVFDWMLVKQKGVPVV